jgi:hypothetical protein
MPPRFAYWTILIDGKPTAFRAREQQELLPTIAQLKRTNRDVAMKWFARGRLWESPDADRAHDNRPTAPSEKRGPEWRPGGAHKDPRDRFKKKHRPARAWSNTESTHRERSSWSGTPHAPRKPWGGQPPLGPKPWGSKTRKPWSPKPDGPRKPWAAAQQDPRKRWRDKPGSGPPAHRFKPAGAGKPWPKDRRRPAGKRHDEDPDKK